MSAPPRAEQGPFSTEIITLVPDLWSELLGPGSGLVGKAFAEGGAARLYVRHLRDYGKGVHRQVDDTPFGGGAGMVLAAPPLHRAIADARQRTAGPVLLLGPRGRRFDQELARELASGPGMILICGRYEGVDERVRSYVDTEVSLGDFVLSAGDPAAWCLVDAVVRLLPGVLGNPESATDESFSRGLLEYPHFTRPVEFEGERVPDILRSGDHGAIDAWRRDQALLLTRRMRPDLVDGKSPNEHGESPNEHGESPNEHGA